MVTKAVADDTDKPLYVVCRERKVIRLYNKRNCYRMAVRSEDGEVKSYAVLVPFYPATQNMTMINRLGRTEEEEVFICSRMHELNAQFGCAQVTSVWCGPSLVWVEYSPAELAIDATSQKFENDIDAFLAKFMSVFGPSLTEEWQTQETSVVDDAWFLRLFCLNSF